MSEFSAGDAALDGFRVIRRHWRVVAGWAGFNLLALVGMVVVSVLGILVAVTAISLTHGASESAAAAGGLIAVVVDSVGTLFIGAIVVAGLFRMLLRDGEPGFFYLRVGLDEVRLVGVWLTLLLGACVLVFLLAGAVALAGRLGTWAGILVGLAGLAGFVWLGVRLSLAAPITFAEHRFGLAAAWRLSRGRFWPLLGMSVLSLCLLALVAVAAWIGLFLIMGALSGFDGSLISLSDPEAL
ncbi:MAG: hypothetical protein ABI655_07595, partial [Phenylobacterium sp.]